MVNYQYIEYEHQGPNKKLFNIPCLTQYMKDNYKTDSCVYSTIIDVYYDSFEKMHMQGQYKYFKLTYKNLWHFIHPDKKYFKQNAMTENVIKMLVGNKCDVSQQ